MTAYAETVLHVNVVGMELNLSLVHYDIFRVSGFGRDDTVVLDLVAISP